MKTDRYGTRSLVIGPFLSLVLLVAAFALLGFLAGGEEPTTVNWQQGDGARHYYGG